MLYVFGTLACFASILVPAFLSMELGIYLTDSFGGFVILCVWMFACVFVGKLLISIAGAADNKNGQNKDNKINNDLDDFDKGVL